MALKLACFVIASLLLGYYVYLPLPENIEEPWKVMLIDAAFRTLGHAGDFAELVGLKQYMEVLMLLTVFEYYPPVSDENVTVTDTTFSNVPVRLYLPKKEASGLRRAVIFFHGGGWCVGSPAMKPYDLFTRWMSERLTAVVVSVDYRLAPHFHFPTQFEDVYSVVKHFLQKDVLTEYSVDPERICVSGDSAGGNLAAAVALQLQDDPDVKVHLKIQALLYPALQTLDLDTPSYRENGDMPILKKKLMVKFWSQYFTTDKALYDAMSSNTLVSSEASHLMTFVNWSNLLPEELKNNHVYKSPQSGSSKILQKYRGITDLRAAPLLADDAKLSKLPLTYMLTCMYDVLRDDGFMYAARLKKAGVRVVHEHFNDTFHGVLLLTTWPTDLSIGLRMADSIIGWLNENL